MGYTINQETDKEGPGLRSVFLLERGQVSRPLLGYNLINEHAEEMAVAMLAKIQHGTSRPAIVRPVATL